MSDDVQFMLGRLEAKVDTLLAFRTEDVKSHEKLETRVSALEKFRWMFAGATVLAVSVAGFLVKIWK